MLYFLMVFCEILILGLLGLLRRQSRPGEPSRGDLTFFTGDLPIFLPMLLLLLLMMSYSD